MATTSNKTTLPGLESHLGYWLRRVSNVVSGSFAKRLQAKHTSVAEWVLLRQLHERRRATPAELADSLGLTRGAVSKVIDKLEAKGWLGEDGTTSDRRVRVLSLSREGRQGLWKLAKVADNNDDHFFDCLSAAEQLALRTLLAKIAQHHGMYDVPTE